MIPFCSIPSLIVHSGSIIIMLSYWNADGRIASVDLRFVIKIAIGEIYVLMKPFRIKYIRLIRLIDWVMVFIFILAD